MVHVSGGAPPTEPRQAARLYRIGLKTGIPDIIVFHKLVYGIELKTAKGDLTPSQKEMFPRLIDSGWADIRVARSIDELFHHLRDWGVPLRGRPK